MYLTLWEVGVMHVRMQCNIFSKVMHTLCIVNFRGISGLPTAEE